MQIDLSLAISFAALAISLLDFYYQRFRVMGAKIDVLNTNDLQRSVPRPYNELPQTIQSNFPYYGDTLNGYILIKVVFGNAGDRVGIANIKDVQAARKSSIGHELIKASYYSYTLIPAYDIVETEILLRGVPIYYGSEPKEMEVMLTVECGGYHPRSSKYLKKATIQETLKISLVAVNETNS